MADARISPRTVGLAFLVAALAVRALACFVLIPSWESSAGVPPAPDSYPDLARTLLTERTLGYGSAGATPTTIRGPGFPAWLASGILTGGEGHGWLAFWTSLPAIFASAAIAGILAARVGLIAGLAGGLVAAAHPLPVIVSGRILSDEFSGVLAVAAIWLLPLALRDMNAAIAAGAALGWHLLTRPTGLLTLGAIVLLIPALRRGPEGAGGWKRGPVLCVLLLGLLPPLLWSARTSALEERPVWVSSLAGYNYWLGRGFTAESAAAPGEAWSHVRPAAIARAGDAGALLEGRSYTDLAPREAAAFDRSLTEAAVAEIRSDPGAFLARSAAGLARFWYRAETEPRSRQYLIAALPVLLLALAGLAVLRRRPPEALAGFDRRVAAGLALFIALHWLAGAAIIPMARYSAQLYPALAVFAGLGAAHLFGRRAPRVEEPVTRRAA